MTKGCYMAWDRYFVCASEFQCFWSPIIPKGMSIPKKSYCLTKIFKFFHLLYFKIIWKCLFFTFLCRNDHSNMTWYVTKTVFFTKPIYYQRLPKVATCLMIDIFGVVQNSYVLIPHNSPQGCHTSRNLIVWQNFFNFFICTISDFLKSAYFPLFDVEMVMEIWLHM